jgi:hypothetical protein
LKLVYIAWLAALILPAADVHAEKTEDLESFEPKYEQTGEAIADFSGEVDIAGAEVISGPLKRFVKNWPQDLVIAPVPGRSPQLGWQLTLAGGYFLESKDKESDVAPSILGGFVMVAENGSNAYGVGSKLNLLQDKLRVNAAVGHGDIRYRLYGIGNIAGDRGTGINIIQEGPIFTTSAKWRVWNKLYIGMGYLGGNIETRLAFNPSTVVPDFDPTLDFGIGAITVPIEYDSRDHEQFPRSGWLLKAKTKIFRESVGSDFEAETSELAINHYRPARDNDAIAFRGYFRTTSGDAPFFLLSTFGGKTDLRGYESGRYRDKMMYALQSEYRWQFNDSWIFTGFAGFGEVAEDISAFGDNYLPAAGVGLRYVLSKKHRVGLSADIAYGKDGAEFYFGVGESF